MWWKRFERNDDRFLSKAGNPRQREEYLKQLVRSRSFSVIGALTNLLAALLELFIQREVTFIFLLFVFVFALMLMGTFIYDLEIRMIKLISSLHQETSNSNAPEKGQTS